MSPSTHLPAEPQPVPAPALERRQARRYSFVQRCFVRPRGATGEGGWRGIGYNLSTTGIGVTLPCPVAAATQLHVTPWGLPRAKPLQARVIRLSSVGFLWFAGCELVEPITEEELQAWLAGPLDWLSQTHPRM